MNPFKRTIPATEADDEALLRNYRQTGDVNTLGSLYQKYMPLVYGVCLKYFDEEERAQDAVMAIFEELVSKARQHEVKQVRGWLYMVTRNYCLMQLRSQKSRQTVSLNDSFMDFTDDVHLGNKYNETDYNALEKCMEKLPQGQQLSVNLFYLQQKCYKEIADSTGLSLNEVKSHIQNGKRNLKICIEKTRE